MYIDLEIGLETTVRNRIRNRTNNELRNRIRTIRRNKLRGTTISAAQQNNIFMNIFFIETKLLPLTAPTLKPIPIPPSRPNDLKHIAIMFNLILMFMIFLILLLIAVVMTTATYRSVVNKQKRDWKMYGRAGETYDKFCSRYYTRYV